MTSLDPITDFWTSQGGSDPASKALSDMHDEGSIHSLHRPTRLDEASADMDRDVMEAVAESKARQSDESDWAEAKPHREWLSERYPDTKLEDYARGMLDWHDRFKRDPYGAKEDWVRQWFAQPPFAHKSKPAAKSEAVPEGTPERWRGDIERDLDVKAAYREAVKDKADRDGYASTAEVRQAIKQATGLSLSAFMEKCRLVDEASLNDPIAVANRFVAFNGGAVTERQVAEQQQQANKEAKVAQAQSLVDHVVATGALPGMGRPEIDNAVANVLNDPSFPRQGDHFLDLRNAHDIALKQLAAGHVPATTAAPDNARLSEAEKAVAWGRDTLPKFAELEGMIGEILSSAGFTPFRTGDPSIDLATAHRAADRFAANGDFPRLRPKSEIYQEVMQEFINAGAAHEKSEAVRRSKRASRSVSGSPSPGASSGGQRDDSSIEDAARAAYRSVAGGI